MDWALWMVGVFLDDLTALGWLTPPQAEIQNSLLFIRGVIPSVSDRAENRPSFESNQSC